LGQDLSSENDSIFLQQVEETKILLEKSIQWNAIGEMNDNFSLAVMKILFGLMSSFFQSKQFILLASGSLKMINLTLQHGGSVYSSLGFSCFAAFFCLCRQEMKTGSHIGKISLLLLEKFPSKESIAYVEPALCI